MVTTFAAPLREWVDLGSVSDNLVHVVQAAFEPTAAVVWVRREPVGSGA